MFYVDKYDKKLPYYKITTGELVHITFTEEEVMLQARSRLFHLHVDATYMPEGLYRLLKEDFGFQDSDFSGHPDNYKHFEPNRHITLKFTDGKLFRRMCAQLEEAVKQFPDFAGYFEGEYIREERLIPVIPYQVVPVPFKISRRRLDGSPFEQFRESELHLTIDKDRSNHQLIEGLLEAGLYGAYMPKDDYVGIVLTIQGFRDDIGRLVDCLWDFLGRSGGVVNGKLKEEFAIWHRLYSVKPTELPEIIDNVVYL